MEVQGYSLSLTSVQDLYARMLVTRIVDEYTSALYQQGHIGDIASCRGHEAAQVGSAICIEVGKDFTLPYYRDLGVVLTIGIMPYEIFRTYIQAHRKQMQSAQLVQPAQPEQPAHHRGYQKHNIVTGTVPVATQILHAAGIAFASKLRKASAVTIAYCSDDAIAEPDFLEGVTFAAHHQLPTIFICERTVSYRHEQTQPGISPLQTISLPLNIDYRCIDGSDVVAINSAMNTAMKRTRAGFGPVLLELQICHESEYEPVSSQQARQLDPLLRCQHYLEEHDAWDEAWATQLRERIMREVEQAMQDALSDG